MLPATYGLIILLDESESRVKNGKRRIGPATIELMTILAQRASPALVSASLFYQVYGCSFDDLACQEEVDTDNFKVVLQDLRTEHCSGWVIKQVNEKMYLLLTEEFLKDNDIDGAVLEEQTSFLTETEKKLGLKVNHMKTVSLDDVIAQGKYDSKEVNYFVNVLPSLFVTKEEYNKVSAPEIPSWVMHLSGHGKYLASIAGLCVQDFKKYLDFLSLKIQTKLLYYNSCYAAGKIHTILYDEENLFSGQTYPFVIITQPLTDARVGGSYYDFIPEKNGQKIRFASEADFVKFLRIATCQDVIDYKELVVSVAPDLTRVGLGSLAQIKFPGVPWFSVIDQEKVVSIGNVLTSMFDQEKSLDVGAFSYGKTGNDDPWGILLYTPEVPFSLIINSSSKRIALEEGSDASDLIAPSIISMLPGNAVHRLKKISTSVHSLDEILSSFCAMCPRGVEKTFIIQEIEIVGAQLITQVIIQLTSETATFYYTSVKPTSFLYKGTFKNDGLEDISLENMTFCTRSNGCLAEYGAAWKEAHKLLYEEQKIFLKQIGLEFKNTLSEILKKKYESFVLRFD